MTTRVTTPPNTLLINRWFLQLDKGIIDDVLTRQIAKHMRERAGFERIAAVANTSTVTPDISEIVSLGLSKIKVIVAQLISTSDTAGQLAAKLRGLHEGDELQFAIPSHSDWTIMVSYAHTQLRVELLGSGIDTLLPAAIELTRDQKVIASVWSDEFGVVSFQNIDRGSYKLEIRLGDERVEVREISI